MIQISKSFQLTSLQLKSCTSHSIQLLLHYYRQPQQISYSTISSKQPITTSQPPPRHLPPTDEPCCQMCHQGPWPWLSLFPITPFMQISSLAELEFCNSQSKSQNPKSGIFLSNIQNLTLMTITYRFIKIQLVLLY